MMTSGCYLGDNPYYTDRSLRCNRHCSFRHNKNATERRSFPAPPSIGLDPFKIKGLGVIDAAAPAANATG